MIVPPQATRPLHPEQRPMQVTSGQHAGLNHYRAPNPGRLPRPLALKPTIREGLSPSRLAGFVGREPRIPSLPRKGPHTIRNPFPRRHTSAGFHHHPGAVVKPFGVQAPNHLQRKQETWRSLQHPSPGTGTRFTALPWMSCTPKAIPRGRKTHEAPRQKENENYSR